MVELSFEKMFNPISHNGREIFPGYSDPRLLRAPRYILHDEQQDSNDKLDKKIRVLVRLKLFHI